MNIRKITVAAALVAIGALALTGCSPSASKKADEKATGGTSSQAGASTSLPAGSWIASVRTDSDASILQAINPAKGTVTTITSIPSDSYPEGYISGDGLYRLNTDSASNKTSVPIVPVAAGFPAGTNLNFVDTIPGYGAKTSVVGVGFDMKAPHTLVATVDFDGKDETLSTWSYDVSDLKKAPVENGSATRESADQDLVLDDHNVPSWKTRAPDTTEDPNAAPAPKPVEPTYLWGKDIDGPGLVDVQAADGTQWSFAAHGSDNTTTLFITSKKQGASDYTAVGKPIQNLPDFYQLKWARPVGK
ncbi:hypothetical protein GCM10025867_50910 (plasmid) [Frondihabitans sucicola]|uniref:Lipoprotein n=1 Tax=Frondihabitans sucicola TaxID=1268041 RepID=A0ABM8GWK6_9MICO|nr:hypothetical protein [Frondihabitans sucicola]BDZ52850.1 hypothetical protein GCM10025867_50910 [Frondihabitans sucicola]